jgi:hypothetical protein
MGEKTVARVKQHHKERTNVYGHHGLFARDVGLALAIPMRNHSTPPRFREGAENKRSSLKTNHSLCPPLRGHFRTVDPPRGLCGPLRFVWEKQTDNNSDIGIGIADVSPKHGRQRSSPAASQISELIAMRLRQFNAAMDGIHADCHLATGTKGTTSEQL